MDHQKVVQVLKDIFERCGTDIVRERRKFEGAINDLLDQQVYRQEYIVLKHAMDSSALWQLTSSAALTGSFTIDAVSKAVIQMQTEGRLTAEDAEFVVECVVDACGGDREILIFLRELKKVEKLHRQEKAEQLWKEEKKRMQEEKERMQKEKDRIRQEEKKHMQKETVILAGLNNGKKKFRFASLYIVTVIAFIVVLLYTAFTVV